MNRECRLSENTEMEHHQCLLDLIQLFKDEQGFNRLFEQFLKKYRGYARVEKNISVALRNPSEEEIRALGGFFGVDYSKHQSIVISAARFEKALQQTKFAAFLGNVSLETVLSLYFGEAFVSNRTEVANFLSEREQFFADVRSGESVSPTFRGLLDWLASPEGQTNRFYSLYRQDKKEVQAVLFILGQVFQRWPLEDYVYLPVFAAEMTGDPHAFDWDKQLGKYLIYALVIIQSLQTGEVPVFELNAEERTELLFSCKILRDDLLNFVTVYHLTGVNLDGSENQLLLGALRERSAFHLPLKEVAKLRNVRSVGVENVVYMVENSVVSSCLMGEAVALDKEVSFVSGNGQLKLASLRLLDLFVGNGGKIYYAGDFDPEGLQIAQKLLQRYGEAVTLWRFGKSDYLKGISNKVLGEKRLSKLNGIVHPALLEIKACLLEMKRAGYQEKLLPDLLADVFPRGAENKL